MLQTLNIITSLFTVFPVSSSTFLKFKSLNYFHYIMQVYFNINTWGGRDNSVCKSSASHARHPGSHTGAAWLGSPNACMKGEEITSCKSHIALVSLTNSCIMILKQTNKHVSAYLWIAICSAFSIVEIPAAGSISVFHYYAFNRALHTSAQRLDKIHQIVNRA